MTDDINNSGSSYPVLGPTGDGSNVTAAFTAAGSRTNISTGEKLSVICGKIAKWFTDLGTAAFTTLDTASLTDDNVHVPSSGVVKSAIAFVPDTGNAGFHNNIYRGKYLGTSVTAAQYAAIDAGTFDDLYIGDYWTIDGVNWRIASFDYWLRKGDTECTTHHVVLVPDSVIGYAKMNSTNTTTGGYVGSDFYTGDNDNTGRATAITKINSAFGSSHILTHREYLTNAVTSGYPSGAIWKDATIELMNEINVYGCMVYTSAINGTAFPNRYTLDYPQFALFRLAPQHVSNRMNWWLRDVVSSTYFAFISGSGLTNYSAASGSLGVRPAFAICA